MTNIEINKMKSPKITEYSWEYKSPEYVNTSVKKASSRKNSNSPDRRTQYDE